MARTLTDRLRRLEAETPYSILAYRDWIVAYWTELGLTPDEIAQGIADFEALPDPITPRQMADAVREKRRMLPREVWSGPSPWTDAELAAARRAADRIAGPGPHHERRYTR